MRTVDAQLRKRIQVSLYALLFLTGLLALSVLLEGCSDTCEVQTEYVYYKPVYTQLADIRSSVIVTSPKEISSSGKIYIKDQWLFVNEPGNGIHVIDNSDPKSPVFRSFINIPGNYDLAVKGNALYADSYVDLLAFDISNVGNISMIKRLENVFSNYNTLGFYLDASNGLITEWQEQTDVKVYESDCEAVVQPWGGILLEDGIGVPSTMRFSASSAIAPGNGSGPGVGGSLARFTISADHLYTLDGSDVQAIDISTETNPVPGVRTQIAWDIETIFPYKDNLFIGASTGMHIVSISSPANPSKIGSYTHVRGCDPVIVDETHAYVTLRSGSTCDSFTNQLEVIDIEDPSNLKSVKVYPMENPHGLGKDQTTLFICDGQAGLKVFDASNVLAIDKNLLAHYQNIDASDVIPFNNKLIMIGTEGIYQYDYSNPKDIKFLSKIAIANEED
jgi:hypothetical protein